MIFEDVIQIKLDKEQSKIVVSALNCYIRRQNRDILRKDRKIIDEAAENGDTERVEKLCNSVQERQERIAESDRIRKMIQQSIKVG